MSKTNSRPRSVLKAGVQQARIEARNTILGPSGLSYLITPVITIILMVFLRDSELTGSAISVAQHFLPGMLALGLVMGGVMGVASELMMEREDGTLLRMKAVPDGLRGYLVGKVLTQLVTNLISALVLLSPALLLFPSAAPASPGGWLMLAGVFVLGVVATIPLGALLGAAMRGMGQLGIVGMFSYGLAAISGIFYPLAALPGWLQVVGQALPLYWLGLGFRQAMLPPEAAMLEVGGGWRTGLMLAILLAWSAIGLLGAPLALRRMIRGVSGSKVAEARDRMLTRGY